MVRSGSFQAAARELEIAQPTVSLHLHKLEQQLGAALIRRNRSGCEPTREALAFLPYAQSLIRLAEKAGSAIRGDCLRIGASSNIGVYMLQPLAKDFFRDRREADFELLIERNPVVADRLESGEIDLALMEWWDRRPGFAFSRWREESLVLIVPPQHSWAQRTHVKKSDLYGLELLGGEPGTGTGRLLERYFGAHPSMPRVSLRLGSTEAVKQAVKAGLGISLVPASAVTDEVRLGTLVALPVVEPRLTKELFLIWRDLGEYGVRHPAFVDYLLNSEAARSNNFFDC